MMPSRAARKPSVYSTTATERRVVKYVLDSSVALKWVLPESDSAKAIQLRLDYQRGVHELVAPNIFYVEAAHALTRAERQRRIAVSAGWRLWRHRVPTLA